MILEQIGFSYRGWTLRNISWKLLGSLGNTQIKRYKDETRTWQNNGVSLLRVLFYTNRVFAVSSLIGSPLLHPLFKITHPCFPICICTVLISSRNKKVIPLQMERGQLRVFASCLWSKKKRIVPTGWQNNYILFGYRYADTSLIMLLFCYLKIQNRS